MINMFNQGAFHFFVMVIVSLIVMAIIAVFVMVCAVFPHVLATVSVILGAICYTCGKLFK
ncbi:hypothetical protein HOR11_gp035 [Lactobacillus phage SA-C12]|uniref:Uncharacterized protein n=1 Tax=Lactobacillus phage SA-C12 TaxID=1755697 RepID=A0A1I9KK79_9CAUD|nr:hypothetical protein HOR11_gp035 [Lactobacillus phage SA-C12]ALY06857.1 hypothetical protein SAC12_035 [Lactobacillus phage SA-C12]